jgi:hypothetical protein
MDFDKMSSRIEKTHDVMFKLMPFVVFFSIVSSLAILGLIGTAIYWLIMNA